LEPLEVVRDVIERTEPADDLFDFLERLELEYNGILTGLGCVNKFNLELSRKSRRCGFQDIPGVREERPRHQDNENRKQRAVIDKEDSTRGISREATTVLNVLEWSMPDEHEECSTECGIFLSLNGNRVEFIKLGTVADKDRCICTGTSGEIMTS
jgi:hypothetical protein